jgi:hypothetical protein
MERTVINPFARQNPRTSIDLYVNKVIGDELHTARLCDLSPSGAFMYRLLEPDIDTEEIGIEMMLPGTDEVIWVGGRVVREEERNGVRGCAIQFTRISSSHRTMIEQFVERARRYRANGVIAAMAA